MWVNISVSIAIQFVLCGHHYNGKVKQHTINKQLQYHKDMLINFFVILSRGRCWKVKYLRFIKSQNVKPNRETEERMQKAVVTTTYSTTTKWNLQD